MVKKRGKITERSLYPPIAEIFKRRNAFVVSEVLYKSQPDFVIEWLGTQWIVSVKIGDPIKNGRLALNAFKQYQRHTLDTGIKHGMIIFFPEEIRKVPPNESALLNFIEQVPAYILVVNPQMEIRDTLYGALFEIERAIKQKIPTTFSLKTVIRLLKEHVVDLMDNITMSEAELTKIITRQELFFGISHKETKSDEVFRFLATYIFLSQVLFLRLYSSEHPTIIEGIDLREITKEKAKILFDRILEINYKPIFEINVLDVIPDEYVADTFRLIWGLKVERIRYELPGRLFHELMPEKIRKLLAAFYTRPIAADLLSHLTIEKENATVFDPACGSGTILTAAYKRKLKLWQERGLRDNPHRKFCEYQIFGADIMPFAVHLTGANLAAMDPGTTIRRVQIVLGDSLKLSPDTTVKPGYRSIMEYVKVKNLKSEENPKAFAVNGEAYNITLTKVDTVLMNPPFTKVERGIKEYVDMDRFKEVVGGEVGLWGHFIALADVFLDDGGIFGGVIPINLLRGRESEKTRKIVFEKWLPLYIVKASRNYGFSEWSEYRDVLVIAKKVDKKPKNHKVKFCVIKKDLNDLTEEDVEKIAEFIKNTEYLRSALVDINSVSLSTIKENFDNLMPFISGPSFGSKDALENIIAEGNRVLKEFPNRRYFREAYRPVPRGVSKFMFITRPFNEGRIQQAFLILHGETDKEVIFSTVAGAQIKKYRALKEHFLPSLRTAVGIDTMDITGKHDYVAKEPYEHIDEIIRLASFETELPRNYWTNVKNELQNIQTNIVITRRINPFSPNQKLIAFYSDYPISPSNQLNVIREKNPEVAKALTVILNSIFFLANFFVSKEETTGRFIDIRFYDLYSMRLYPRDEKQVKKLVEVYEKYKNVSFPALTTQISKKFEERYHQFWAPERKNQSILEFAVVKYEPHPLRLAFDLEVARAIGAKVTEKDLIDAYKAIEEDMIITRGLKRD
ncbi:SAM-dependent DNA methyltransferase [Thermococcus sp. GR7]|uniref:N-6 DNA methylase n=1 Tax=unclassified Thermococcus TaxID=2627626 RepID=UPI0014319D3F|nr:MULTISPECIES: N-6 DNA methylase [unclassified Thermococcus]NJE46642.1 SAM-dependent DNA methyltransferase [Thermococcus sp. GR7]NJE77930.1 SAM-dependent DNA methyltransferase [Thermococcus sp. GR4]NJF23058.1 SAM-dependent DNA methyltransferase [Thermococcus sp. GR5]